MEGKPQKPRVVTSLVERIGSANYMNLFTYRVNHSLADVLAPGYWRNMQGLERCDRIVVSASCETDSPEHATLVVTATDPAGGALVELLREATGGK